MYWAWIGAFYLVWLTVQDLRRNIVDDRKNWFMYGFSFGLIYIYKYHLWYVVAIIGLSIIFGLIANALARGRVGAGDTSALTWILTGFLLINPWFLVGFMVFFTFFVLILVLANWLVVKSKGKIPFFPVILGSFVCTCMAYGLFK